MNEKSDGQTLPSIVIYRGSVDRSPDIAAALGAYVAEFSNIEVVLEVLLGTFVLLMGMKNSVAAAAKTFAGAKLELSTQELAKQLVQNFAKSLSEQATEVQQIGHTILGHLQSFSLRCDILESAVTKGLSTESEQANDTVFHKFIAGAREINTRRNEYVHGTYTYNTDNGEVRLLTWETFAARKKKSEILSADTIKKDLQKIRETLGVLVPKPGDSPSSELSS